MCVSTLYLAVNNTNQSVWYSALLACLKQLQGFVEVHDSSRDILIIQGTSCVPWQLCSLLKLDKSELWLGASAGRIGFLWSRHLWLLLSWFWDGFGCRVMCVRVHRHSPRWGWVGLGEPHWSWLAWRREKGSLGTSLTIWRGRIHGRVQVTSRHCVPTVVDWGLTREPHSHAIIASRRTRGGLNPTLQTPRDLGHLPFGILFLLQDLHVRQCKDNEWVNKLLQELHTSQEAAHVILFIETCSAFWVDCPDRKFTIGDQKY